MKYILILYIIILSLVSLGCNRNFDDSLYECGGQKGIGPSPNFCFTIENVEDYPEFSFYYEGKLKGDQLYEMEDINEVYKLDTIITIYAVPNELAEKYSSSVILNFVDDDSLRSEEIQLNSGNNVFKITSFDKENKKMQLEVIK